MGNYMAGLAAIFLFQIFRAVTIIILFVISENLQESNQLKSRIFNIQKIITSKRGPR